MARIRREVRTLGSVWPEPLLWYARAVRTMQSRPLTDRTSWLFFGAIHGVHPTVWIEFGLVQPDVTAPPARVQRRFWNQCQHQSWYFLPWHRGYLSAFEQVARAAVVAAGGPEDWALPYWNYSDTTRADARTLPEAFAEETLPDGTDNPLRVERRYGSGTVPISIAQGLVSVASLDDMDFTGGVGDIPPGFGGPRTLFHHGPESETTNGGVESAPHNNVHGAIGGSIPGEDPNDWRNFGLMTTPLTAALDPIFWLHHANIDRLWSTWRRRNDDPTDESWLGGPADRPFAMPTSAGEWAYTARDVLDTSASPLDYVYDDEIEPLELPPVDQPGGAQAPVGGGVDLDEGGAMTPEAAPELIGASDGGVHVVGETGAPVKMDGRRTESLRRKLDRGGAADAENAAPLPRVFLKLEGIHGTSDAALYYVYVNLPAGEDPAAYPDRLAGTLSLFGISAASDRNGPHAGSGINQVLEISSIVDSLHLSGDDLAALDIRFVPANETVAAADFRVARMSVFMLET
ncbi:tyrosinase family protein [Microbacterium deminutum]|uniref:Tyrosinase family protein n=1 Tax=Microbacterium deminutum TaxID=344164 RepID=A0ABP5BXB2_9MICO